MSNTTRRTLSDRWWALALGLAALALYVATLAPSVATVFDDSLEFQVVLPSLGIAHPTGYPLYTILGWAFSHIPLHDLAYRVNLLSALAGAATVGVLFLVARQLGSSRLDAATISVVFALSTTWWSQATIAEVYTLNGLFVALILYLTLSLDTPRRTPSALRTPHSALRSSPPTQLRLKPIRQRAWQRSQLLRPPGRHIDGVDGPHTVAIG